jgi:hypothetical protein
MADCLRRRSVTTMSLGSSKIALRSSIFFGVGVERVDPEERDCHRRSGAGDGFVQGHAANLGAAVWFPAALARPPGRTRLSAGAGGKAAAAQAPDGRGTPSRQAGQPRHGGLAQLGQGGRRCGGIALASPATLPRAPWRPRRWRPALASAAGTAGDGPGAFRDRTCGTPEYRGGRGMAARRNQCGTGARLHGSRAARPAPGHRQHGRALRTSAADPDGDAAPGAAGCSWRKRS